LLWFCDVSWKRDGVGKIFGSSCDLLGMERKGRVWSLDFPWSDMVEILWCLEGKKVDRGSNCSLVVNRKEYLRLWMDCCRAATPLRLASHSRHKRSLCVTQRFLPDVVKLFELSHVLRKAQITAMSLDRLCNTCIRK
jgi:hypothetical protein